MGTHPIFESDFDCLTEWIVRLMTTPKPTKFHQGENKAKVFIMQVTKKSRDILEVKRPA